MSNEVIRRALLARLAVIGVAPDLHNDDPAVRSVCSTLGVSAVDVVRELTLMRLEQASAMVHRMGGSGISPGVLTILSASRDTLLEHVAFDRAFRRRAEQPWQELVEELDLEGMGFGSNPRRERAAA